MFIVSVKSSKIKVVLAAIAVMIFAAITVLYLIGKNTSLPEETEKNLNYCAQTAQDRVAFLAQFGWEINEEPIECKEVTIPQPFDDVYEKYNALQKEQSFDLLPYCGKTVQSWSYRVLNYPGYEENSDVIRANLLTFEGLVIGGDISNITLDGFMQPLDVLTREESVTEQTVFEPVE